MNIFIKLGYKEMYDYMRISLDEDKQFTYSTKMTEAFFEYSFKEKLYFELFGMYPMKNGKYRISVYQDFFISEEIYNGEKAVLFSFDNRSKIDKDIETNEIYLPLDTLIVYCFHIERAMSAIGTNIILLNKGIKHTRISRPVIETFETRFPDYTIILVESGEKEDQIEEGDYTIINTRLELICI